MGELLYLSACSGSTEVAESVLISAMRRFCRSIELCDGYLRGYYGLKIVSRRATTVQSCALMTTVLTFGPGHQQIAAVNDAGFEDNINCRE